MTTVSAEEQCPCSPTIAHSDLRAPGRRLKVLVSAYACEPGKGSEPYVGWNLPLQLSYHHEIWVLTRSNNRECIEAELQRNPQPGLHIAYLDLPRWASFWKKGRRGIHLYYFLWQVRAFFVARRLHREVGFDVTHHLTFGMDWLPSLLAFLPIPFVWGPIIGAQSVSTPFRRRFARGEKIRENIRTWVRQLSWFDPFMHSVARRTALAMASGSEIGDRLRRMGCRNIMIYPSIGLSGREVSRFAALKNQNCNDKVRFLYVGNLYAFRAVSSALAAFAQIQRRSPNVEFWIVGDGPERQRLMDQSGESSLTGAVKFWGARPRHEVLQLLAACDVLLYPCLRGAISMACLEAMAAGLPVICLDLGGVALQVSEETGTKVPAVSPEQLVRDLMLAMGRLAGDQELRRRLGETAQKRVQSEFTWDAKAQHISECYRQAVVTV